MSPTPAQTKVTIDFRDAVHPSRSWILGVDERTLERVELIAFDTASVESTGTPMTAQLSVAECACPEFCELDHANE